MTTGTDNGDFLFGDDTFDFIDGKVEMMRSSAMVQQIFCWAGKATIFWSAAVAKTL